MYVNHTISVSNKIMKTFLMLFLIITLIIENTYCFNDVSRVNLPVQQKLPRYILYDVNTGEGFNLKRDVYMRMAMFVKMFADKLGDDWYLVLPPWTKQWHWTNEENHVSYQWCRFFDIESLQRYVTVIELPQYHSDYGQFVDKVFILQHFPEFYNWTADVKDMDWSDKWSDADCRDKQPYWKKENSTFVFFHGDKHVTAKDVKCISFQGSSGYLESVVISTNARSILFDRAEVATHIMYGDSNYWRCRRSMRFAKDLVQVANQFRAKYLNSTDVDDRTVRPLDWRDEQPGRSAIGGPYLGVHLRRQDFVLGRAKDIPSLKESVEQIRKYLKENNLTTVFIATDMPWEEYEYINRSLQIHSLKSFKFNNVNDQFSDGEVAIIDQIITSHARFFVGTFESTFTYRIQEEREIMGFPAKTTFNRFCPTSKQGCTPPTKWLIKYPCEDNILPADSKVHFGIDEL